MDPQDATRTLCGQTVTGEVYSNNPKATCAPCQDEWVKRTGWSFPLPELADTRMTVDFDDLSIGDRVMAYNNEWEVQQLAGVTHSIYVVRRNASGKQIIATTWVQPDEIDRRL